MRNRGPLVAAIIGALVVVIAVVALLLPRISAVGERQKDLEQAQEQEETLRAQLAQLQDARRQARLLKRQLARLETKVPPTADLPSLIRLLQGAADRAGVDFLAVSPGTPLAGTAGSVSAIPTEINVDGSFFSVEEFLFRLETLPRAVKVTQINVVPGQDGLPDLSLTMSSEVYTTDTSAGPGSAPGPTEGGAVVASPAPTEGA